MPPLRKSPEMQAKKAALPSAAKIALVKKWANRLKNMPNDVMPTMPVNDDDVVAFIEQQQNEQKKSKAAAAAAGGGGGKKQQQQGKGKGNNSNDYDWREVAEFDKATVLEVLNELAAGKEEEVINEEEDELRYGALTRAISRFDERPANCFTRDILVSMLDVAANCESILLGTPAVAAASGSDSAAAGAAAAAATTPVNKLLIGESHVLLTKLQCYCIMACSFLGIFPRINVDCVDESRQLPSINLTDMFVISTVRLVGPVVHVEKLLMFFEYFATCSRRHISKDPRMTSRDFGVIFARGVTPAGIPPSFDHDAFRQNKMGDLRVLNLRESIDDQKNTIRVDFANAVVGGASLSYGCVQEEIMFAECPEMNCSRWLCPTMEDNEAILIVRGEQFAKHAGYAHSLIYQGPHKDADGDILQSAVLAVDALDFRYLNPSAQYGADGVRREFNKLCAAMAACELARSEYGVDFPSTVCTGNWGCGVFGGDAEVKALVQWLVFSIHGVATMYAPFDNAPLLSRLRDVSVCCAARKEKLTPADVGQFLMNLSKVVRRGQSVLEIFAAAFKLDLSMAGESLRRPPQKRGA